MSEPILELRDVTRIFGGVKAVDSVSFTLGKGDIVGLIGPNGAGKTTLVNLISGMLPLSSGEIRFEGKPISRTPPHRIARNGIARTFQIVQPFSEMTVLENVTAGSLFAGRARGLRNAAERARHYLGFVGLEKFSDYPAAQLSLANRKRLELAKSLAMEPRLLLLDEVNAGLNSGEIQQALNLLNRIAQGGVTIVIIEHLMRVVATLTRRILVLHHGALLSEGTPDQVFEDERVIRAYLGNKFAQRHQARPGLAKPADSRGDPAAAKDTFDMMPVQP